MSDPATANVVAVAQAQARTDSESVYRDLRIAHWDRVARSLDAYDRWNRGYHGRLYDVFRSIVPAGSRVLDIGCGDGNLLASVSPAVGVGVDFSAEMTRLATSRHPGLRFVLGDGEELDLGETFDFVILSDLVNDVWDVQRLFERVHRHAHAGTRIVLNFWSRMWELPLRVAKMLGLSRPTLEQNWLTVEDIENLLYLSDCEVVRRSVEILWPLRTPAVAPFVNRVLVKTWPFSLCALTHVIVARPRPSPRAPMKRPKVSILIPARNEVGNIAAIFRRVPDLGAATELVFVEGHSRDGTFATIEREIVNHPDRQCVLLRQTGEGKGNAVREGFARASGDVLMILDADLTVAPEDLPRFYDALASGAGEFVNGVRLVYPMDHEAMRFANLLANKFFSLAFSWLLGQPIKDTLCGTKALWRRDYLRIAANRSHFGDFDPFGDFDLLFGAAKLNLRIIEIPIRYRQRAYGSTNIRRWRHGVLLVRMAAIACRKLKWV